MNGSIDNDALVYHSMDHAGADSLELERMYHGQRLVNTAVKKEAPALQDVCRDRYEKSVARNNECFARAKAQQVQDDTQKTVFGREKEMMTLKHAQEMEKMKLHFAHEMDKLKAQMGQM